MERIHSKLWLYGELVTLMLLVPGLLYLLLPPSMILPVIWIVALYCHVVDRAVTQESHRVWWNAGALTWVNLEPILRRFALSAFALTVLATLFTPDLLFRFVAEKTNVWLAVMILYPVLSVVPQEIIFRSFFFTRYRTLFPHSVALILASGITFGLAHLVFHNWVAPVLCTIGGIYFAITYHRHRSMALVCLEHALYGDFLFTLGLGKYFYHGAVAH